MACRRLLLVALLLLPAVHAEAPTCERVLPADPVPVKQWDKVDFEVKCSDIRDKDLAWISWSVDGLLDGTYSTPSNETQNARQSIYFNDSGTHYVRATGIDRNNTTSDPVLWVVQVQLSDWTGETADAGLVSSEAAPASGFLSDIDPVGAFSAVVGAIVGIGGLALAVVQYRRHRGGGDEDAKASAVAVHVEQKVGNNTGTVIGQAGQVVVQAPAPSVPPGVPPHKQALYLSLAKAHDALDRLPVDEATLEARELVGDVMEKLARGEMVVREARRPAASAVARVLAGVVPAAERAALADAAGQLGR